MMSSMSLTKISKRDSSKFGKLKKKKKEDATISVPNGKFTKIESPESKAKLMNSDQNFEQRTKLNGFSATRNEDSEIESSKNININSVSQTSTKSGELVSTNFVNERSRKFSNISTKNEATLNQNGKYNEKPLTQDNEQPSSDKKIQVLNNERPSSSVQKPVEPKVQRNEIVGHGALPGTPAGTSSSNDHDHSSPDVQMKTNQELILKNSSNGRRNSQDRPPLNRRRSTYTIDLITGISGAMSQESPEPPDQTPVDVTDDVLDAFNSMTLVTDDTASETSSHSSMTSSNHRDDVISKNSSDGVPNLWMEDNTPEKVVVDEPEENQGAKKKKLFKNPIKLLKKTLSQGEMPAVLIAEPDLSSVTIDSLPQQFVTKFLGKKKCTGLQGLEYIRGPIDKMVREITGNPEANDLPLVQLTVWPKGLQATIHPKTRSRDFQNFYLPIDFVSFCAEHGSYQKIVGVISVTHLGPKTTKTECSAYICHSALEARKLTVSMATAFKMYAERLNGSQVKFKVDLRSGEEKGRRRSHKEFEA